VRETRRGMRSKSANSLSQRDVTTPSQAPQRRRCRDWTGAAYVSSRLIGSRHSPDHKREGAVAKAIVVRKSAARKGVRVRLPAIPKSIVLIFTGSFEGIGDSIRRTVYEIS
jgi:hypothetical protein